MSLPWEEQEAKRASDPVRDYERTRVFWQYQHLSVKNLHEMPFTQMLEELEGLVLDPVPEGTQRDPELLSRVDRLLGRYANVYTFLTHAWAVAGWHASRYKAMGDDGHYKDMVVKRETLYRLARAVEFKYQAASRMLTLHIEESEDLPERVDVRRRAERAEERLPTLREVFNPLRARRDWDDVR